MHTIPHQLILTTTLVLGFKNFILSTILRHQETPEYNFIEFASGTVFILFHKWSETVITYSSCSSFFYLSTCPKFGIFFFFTSFFRLFGFTEFIYKDIYFFVNLFISLEVFIWPPGFLWGWHPVTLCLWNTHWIHCLLPLIFSY